MMLFGLVAVVHVAQYLLFGEKTEDPKVKKQRRDDIERRYKLQKAKQRLARKIELNQVYDEQAAKIQKEIDDLRECIEFQKNLIKVRKEEFEHLEVVNGICHCNECIETDMRANRRSVNRYRPTEELWIE